MVNSFIHKGKIIRVQSLAWVYPLYSEIPLRKADGSTEIFQLPCQMTLRGWWFYMHANHLDKMEEQEAAYQESYERHHGLEERLEQAERVELAELEEERFAEAEIAYQEALMARLDDMDGDMPF